MKKDMNLKNFFNIKLDKKEFNLYISFFLYSLIPSFGILMRTIVITKYAQVSLNTYAQGEYLNIMLEVFQETLIFPLFFFVGKVTNSSIADLNKIRQIYLFIFLLYSCLIIMISFFSNNLIELLDGKNYKGQLIFFNLQLFSKIPDVLLLVSTVFLLNFGKSIFFFLILLMKLIIFVVLDLTLANKDIFSNAYIGLGLSSILTNTLLFIFSLFLVGTFFQNKNFGNLKTFKFTKVMFSKIIILNTIFTLISSLLNNGFYLGFIAKPINTLNIADSYGISNQLIGNGLLLPVIALIEVFKSVIAVDDENNKEEINFKLFKYLKISLIIFIVSATIIYLIGKPFTIFITNQNQDQIIESFTIFKVIIWFYGFFVGSSIIEALFIGKGKLSLLLIKSIIINLLIYLIPNIFLGIKGDTVSLTFIILIFGFSMLGSFLINIVIYCLNLKYKFIF